MTNTELLREAITRSGLKLQFIADTLGISRFALNNKIENKSQFKSGEIKTLCNLLGIESLSEKELIFFA
jgi:hypothetical protein